jgi:Cys-rich protein (TIGR01571 family)
MRHAGRAIAAAALFIYPSAAAVVRTSGRSKEPYVFNDRSPKVSGGSPPEGIPAVHPSASTFGTGTEWTSHWWLDSASAELQRGPNAFLRAGEKQEPDPLVVSAPPGAADSADAAVAALRAMILFLVLSSSICVALGVCFVAHQYREHKAMPKVSKYQRREDFAGFKTGVFDFWGDLPLCCFVAQCPCIVWADNLSSVSVATEEPRTVPVLNFWIALITMLVLFTLCNLGGIVVWIITAFVMAYFRQKFRKAFAMTTNTGSCIQDVLLYLCCGCCIIAQDARHVEEARNQDHPAVVKIGV